MTAAASKLTPRSESFPASARWPLLISITWRAISASLALEPMVLVSRNISWVRNSSLRPFDSCAAMIASNCSRWLLQAHDLLGDVAPLGEHADLADDVGRLDPHAQFGQQLVQPLGEPAAVGIDDQRRTALDRRQLGGDRARRWPPGRLPSPGLRRSASGSGCRSASCSVTSISGHWASSCPLRPSARRMTPGSASSEASEIASSPAATVPSSSFELRQIARQHRLVEAIIVGRRLAIDPQVHLHRAAAMCWRTTASTCGSSD